MKDKDIALNANDLVKVEKALMEMIASYKAAGKTDLAEYYGPTLEKIRERIETWEEG